MAANDPPMSTGHDLAIALRDAYLALHRRSDAQFARHGVTADQFVLLAALARGGEALTQRGLARRRSSDPSTVRPMLVLLSARGLVEREKHQTDARARTVSLTAKGLRAYRRLWKAGEPIRARMVGALGPGEAETLVQLLGQVAEALNAECVPAGPGPKGRLDREVPRAARRHGAVGVVIGVKDLADLIEEPAGCRPSARLRESCVRHVSHSKRRANAAMGRRKLACRSVPH
jgi:DNA-binding MarR family transcriptional regulator